MLLLMIKNFKLIGRLLDEKIYNRTDAGTTSNRSILFDLKGKPVFSSQKNLPNTFQKVDGSNMMQMRFGELLQKHLKM